MSSHPEAPPELAVNTFANWLLNPTPITESEMAELAADTFGHGQGLRWLEGFMWQVMFSTPTDMSGEMAIRDLGKQDMVRVIVAQVHTGLNSRQATRRSGDGGTGGGDYRGESSRSS